MQAPVFVVNAQTKRETGRKAQKSNVAAAQAVAEIVRTCLGPKAMLKMIMDQSGGLALTNDGNAILREIDVSHPAAKSMIELSRAQDEEVGDGTTSVIVLAAEMLGVALPYLEKNVAPTLIVSSYVRALDDALEIAEKFVQTIDLNNRDEIVRIVKSCVGTKFIQRWSDLMCGMAIDAVRMVSRERNGRTEVDIKKYAKIEKIPGGDIEDSRVLNGVMMNKDVLHAQMRRTIENPRILLLDCPIEYKKLESQANVEITKDADFSLLLKQEEQFIEKMVADIVKHRPDIVITEKGLDDLAQHHFVKHGVTAFRRLRKTDNNRIARAVGARIVSRVEEITEDVIGTGCGHFEVRKVGDEYYSFFEQCKAPLACSILLRGASKDVLSEIERNLQDAMHAAKNVILDPRVAPGGGAFEMALSQHLAEKAKAIEGVAQWPYRAVAIALEVIPRTLAENCGANTVRLLTELRARHAHGENATWGVDGNKGVLADMNELGVFEPFAVKLQTVKTAIEAACMLLRIDDIVSGIASGKGAGPQQEVPIDNQDYE